MFLVLILLGFVGVSALAFAHLFNCWVSVCVPSGPAGSVVFVGDLIRSRMGDRDRTELSELSEDIVCSLPLFRGWGVVLWFGKEDESNDPYEKVGDNKWFRIGDRDRIELLSVSVIVSSIKVFLDFL